MVPRRQCGINSSDSFISKTKGKAASVRSSLLAALIARGLLATSCSASDSNSSARAANDLCSTAGLAKLVPQLRDANGKFTIPNPNKNLAQFVAAQRG